MATTKLSALAAHTTTDGAEELLINDGGHFQESNHC